MFVKRGEHVRTRRRTRLHVNANVRSLFDGHELTVFAAHSVCFCELHIHSSVDTTHLQYHPDASYNERTFAFVCNRVRLRVQYPSLHECVPPILTNA